MTLAASRWPDDDARRGWAARTAMAEDARWVADVVFSAPRPATKVPIRRSSLGSTSYGSPTRVPSRSDRRTLTWDGRSSRSC